MIMNKYILVFVVAFTASCASLQKEVASPYEQYGRFIDSLERKDSERSLSLLSDFNIERFKKRESNESFDYFFPFFSSIDTVVAKEVGHFQKIYNNSACLTVVGFDKKNEPTSISFQFVKEEGNWKFNLVHMIYHESANEFPSEALCPEIP